MGSKLLAEFQPLGSKYYYYTSDQINSTRIVTDSAGTVVSSSLYDPYGGVQKQWVNTYQPSLKFSGKEREGISELDYFGARYYGHRQYRFLSVDPEINKDEAMGNPQLWNLYAYCRNNPIIFIDPDGLDNYVFYDPNNFSSQASAEASRIMEISDEPTHQIPISTISEFISNWNAMKNPSNVTLIFHSGNYAAQTNTISIDWEEKQYLTNNPNGTTPSGEKATYIGNIKKFSMYQLNLYICHSAEGRNSIAKTFFQTQAAGIVMGADGYVNFNWFSRHPKESTSWINFIRNITWVNISK
jgi:RHS repeat-associated protein